MNHLDQKISKAAVRLRMAAIQWVEYKPDLGSWDPVDREGLRLWSELSKAAVAYKRSGRSDDTEMSITKARASLAQLLAQYRAAQELTFRELAVEVGCSIGYLSDMENGARIPSRAVAEKLDAVLANGMPVFVNAARSAVVARWEAGR